MQVATEITSTVHDQLEAVAADLDRSKAWILRRALLDYLARHNGTRQAT